ncbi:glutathione S-transferase family protein [Yoonia sp. I 8.24]|uniref:glutathione S-transferase family protein n=1 Tax=Yoonia sp. I 8.24 TaxID=1537229 RepID=UPI001EE10121|nr:glutathione S-transferase family protein [Yoonia sp. I 8.24]MCG3267380.1 glutathione S-transferase family protein [Yoonia sp. I 8.24]
MLTLFHSPGSCSDGIFLLLEEVGAEYEVEVIDLKTGGQRDPAFLARNPKGKVPSLMREDGSVLTEFQTIAYWLANHFDQAGVWPEQLESQSRTLEALDFIVGSVHMRGFTLVKVPQKFQLDAKGTEDLRAYGRSEVEKGLIQLSRMLGDALYLLGTFGIADAAIFYVLRWATQEGFDVPENLQDFLARMQERPAVQRLFG